MQRAKGLAVMQGGCSRLRCCRQGLTVARIEVDNKAKGDVMATHNEPVTREDLRHELQHYATKADLAALETRMIKWVAGFVVGGLASIAGLTAVIVRVVGGG